MNYCYRTSPTHAVFLTLLAEDEDMDPDLKRVYDTLMNIIATQEVRLAKHEKVSYSLIDSLQERVAILESRVVHLEDQLPPRQSRA